MPYEESGKTKVGRTKKDVVPNRRGIGIKDGMTEN